MFKQKHPMNRTYQMKRRRPRTGLLRNEPEQHILIDQRLVLNWKHRFGKTMLDRHY